MNIINFFLDLLFPRKCIVCDNVFEFSEHEKYLCDDCKDLFEIIKSRRCEKCSRPIVSGNLCSVCNSQASLFDLNYSFFEYDGIIPEMIYKFKFRNHPVVGVGLGKIMAESPDLNLMNNNFDFIIPVPIHKLRRKKRGFNQAEILAHEISKKISVPTRTDILKRIKNTKAQWSLNAHERENNLKDAFTSKKINNKNLILIDDIFTTGSTINKCSEVLKNAGAKYVLSFTFAITNKNISTIQKSRNLGVDNDETGKELKL